jgi:hypothetical protein
LIKPEPASCPIQPYTDPHICTGLHLYTDLHLYTGLHLYIGLHLHRPPSALTSIYTRIRLHLQHLLRGDVTGGPCAVELNAITSPMMAIRTAHTLDREKALCLAGMMDRTEV